ncbi:hypothetical protein BDP27DRAFT_1248625 [Rhodocollybia butyracea]|uniref:Uncharacterized protein n=1 Tax=Rhodocollybia butyracea TaxID=206335 RepID=A0A9P5TUP9_9AGAR|nr:hypothetical protein BDP27DRAFT_1248625 [Rhodocollybia butyracea]
MTDLQLHQRSEIPRVVSEELAQPKIDDIRVDFHPRSEKPSTTYHFQEYIRDHPHTYNIPTDFTPWKPFRTKLDFDVSEFALRAGLNTNLTNDLIGLLNRCAQGQDDMTIKDSNEMQAIWDLASFKSTEFQSDTVAVNYGGEDRIFEMHYRSLLDWMLDIVTNPELSSKLTWDAEKLYKFNGVKWERFIEEPWTADTWWKVQSQMPEGLHAKPFFIILYADKNKLSSFGTEKGYPVIARCANLPQDMRNGVGLGGGRLVGWLPVVKEDSRETGKKQWADFKSIVWHESFLKILESVTLISSTGQTLICADGIQRDLYPYILILSSDYEEQCVMTLIRGLRGLCPCPKCLVRKDDLSDLTKQSPLRTAQGTVDILKKVNTLTRQSDKEEILKQNGLRPYPNVFFKMVNSDPFAAVSFDNLHFCGSGLFEDHIFKQLKLHIEKSVGRNIAVTIDMRVSEMPRWPGLNHFNTVTNVSFNDGSKLEDIAKASIFLFAAHDQFPNDKAAFQLLKCLRAYLDMTMYAGLDLHLESTLEKLKDAILKLDKEVKVYDSLTYGTVFEKSWNFIKLHYHVHLYDDIQSKGVLRGFSTKPNEKVHGPLRKIYHDRTNFKNVAEQIVRINQQCMVAAAIQSQVLAIEEFAKGKNDSEDTKDSQHEALGGGHFYLGSLQKKLPLMDLEVQHSTAPVFQRFRIRLGEFMTKLLVSSGIPLPNNQHVKFIPNDTVIPAYYLKINYESEVTWCSEVDLLRSNPNFYKQSRYDFILVKTETGAMVAQLLYPFICIVGEKQYGIALIRPYKVVQRRSRLDKELGLIRLQREADSEFISIHSIIRGVVSPLVAAEDPQQTDRFLFDVLDGDTTLRMRKLFPYFFT